MIKDIKDEILNDENADYIVFRLNRITYTRKIRKDINDVEYILLDNREWRIKELRERINFNNR